MEFEFGKNNCKRLFKKGFRAEGRACKPRHTVPCLVNELNGDEFVISSMNYSFFCMQIR